MADEIGVLVGKIAKLPDPDLLVELRRRLLAADLLPAVPLGEEVSPVQPRSDPA